MLQFARHSCNSGESLNSPTNIKSICRWRTSLANVNFDGTGTFMYVAEELFLKITIRQITLLEFQFVHWGNLGDHV